MPSRKIVLLLTLLALLATLGGVPQARAAEGMPPGGQSVLPPDALLSTLVGNLANTHATAGVAPVAGEPFTRALRVTIGTDSAETNATQLTMPISVPVAKGDVLMASFFLRGTAADGKSPAQVQLLFERTTDPWTKSLTQGASTLPGGTRWRRVVVPFTAAESYRPGEAMVSLRLAFGPQTVEVGRLSVVDYAQTRTLEELVTLSAEAAPLGPVRLTVRMGDARQTMVGLGGNFCQPRYGSSEPMDAVGAYNLEHLRVAQARVGIPLNVWAPAPGVFRDEGPAHAALVLMQTLARRHIPLIGTVWEGPQWMLGGQPEQSGRTLPPEKYADCIEAISQFLVTARDKYGATVDEFSFNEADAGINFRWPPDQLAVFIRQAGPRWRALGLPTRFLVGDTTGGAPLPGYVRPLLSDPTLAPYLGPIAFHCWDVLGAPDARYAEIAALGRQYHKPIWCTEAGHDAQLWQAPNPWASWDNALRTVLAYAKTLRLTGASVLDYWTYQDNYPLVAHDPVRPYPVFSVVRQMEDALPAGARVVSLSSDTDALDAVATRGPHTSQFSLLLVNPTGAGQVTVAGLPPGASASVIRSTVGAQAEAMTSAFWVDHAGRLTVPMPTRSVVTVQSTMGKSAR